MRRRSSPFEELKYRIIQIVGILLLASIGCAAVMESSLFAVNSLIFMGGTMILTTIVMAVEVFRRPKT